MMNKSFQKHKVCLNKMNGKRCECSCPTCLVMNKAPAFEVNGSLLRFKVIFVSASDYGHHGGGDRKILYDGFDIVEAISIARKRVDWGYNHLEVEGWR